MPSRRGERGSTRARAIAFRLGGSLQFALSFLLANACHPGAGHPLGAPARARASLPLRVGLVQLSSEHAGRFDVMLALAKEAKQRGADVAVFPEESRFGWLNPEAFTRAAPIPGPDAQQFADLARAAGVWIVAGLAEQGPAVDGHPGAHLVYDSALFIDPTGRILLHHRQHNVVKNAFDETACRTYLGTDKCSYAPGPIEDVRVIETPFGRIGLMVCADAYAFDPTVLDALRAQRPDAVFVPWGVTAGQESDCGQPDFNATEYAALAAKRIGSVVVGANAAGPRRYGRFLPSLYCGHSGWATPAGERGGESQSIREEVAFFEIELGEGAR